MTALSLEQTDRPINNPQISNRFSLYNDYIKLRLVRGRKQADLKITRCNILIVHKLTRSSCQNHSIVSGSERQGLEERMLDMYHKKGTK